MHPNAGDAEGPAFPLLSSQAGVLESKQFYLAGMAPKMQTECITVLKQLRGARNTYLTGFVTHIVVGEQCYIPEKCEILQFLDGHGDLCHVVHASWLFACAKVCAIVSANRNSKSSAFKMLVLCASEPRLTSRSLQRVVVQAGCRARCLAMYIPTNLMLSSCWMCLQAQCVVGEAQHAVNLTAWREECADNVAPTQNAEPFAGKQFYVDSLDDPDEKRSAKETVRVLGGTVRRRLPHKCCI